MSELTPEKIMKSGIELIADERQRQVSVEGWTPEHDDEHKNSEMALAALCYASPVDVFIHGIKEVQINSSRGISDAYSYAFREVKGYWDPWPWDEEWKKISTDPIRNLTKAGALIAAEIDRLQRANEKVRQ